MKTALDALDYKEGTCLLIDKPNGWTSFAIIAQVKRWTQAKVGHAGTLDPLASGLMICCTGKWTRKLHELTGLPKVYTGTIHLGYTTPTYDLESEPVFSGEVGHLTPADFDRIQTLFQGEIEQLPPIHSAIKQNGQPVYALARKGKTVTMQARKVTLSEFEITRIQLPEIDFRVACSSGTYIRTLAFDIGHALGCGAYLQSLRRTEIGPYSLQDAWTLDEMRAYFGTSINTRLIVPKIPLISQDFLDKGIPNPEK